MEIRNANEEDFDAIIKLVPSQEELFLVYPKGKHPFSVDQLRMLAETRKELTVLVHDGTVIGFANLYDLVIDHSVFIGNVVISHSYRGSGLGRKLVDQMVQAAFEKYVVSEARLSVFSENTPALLLYASMGFKPFSIEARQHPTGKLVALIHMRVKKDDYHLDEGTFLTY